MRAKRLWHAIVGLGTGAVVGGVAGFFILAFSRDSSVHVEDLTEEAVLGGVIGAFVAWSAGLGRASRVMERYRREGLTTPLRFRPGLMHFLFLVGACSFLIFGCLLAVSTGNLVEQAIGAFGMVFFGLGLVSLAWLSLSAPQRGFVEFSRTGVFLSHAGLEIAWSDIGPAWVTRLKRSGITIGKELIFIVRNAAQYRAQIGPSRRWLWKLSEKVAVSQSGAVDFGLKAFGRLSGEDDITESGLEQIKELRRRIAAEPGSTVMTIPTVFRLGLRAEDAAEIINTEVLLRKQSSKHDVIGKSVMSIDGTLGETPGFSY